MTISTGRMNSLSGDDRSCSQRNGACRSSMRVAQHGVEREQERHLDQQRQAAAGGIDAFPLVQLARSRRSSPARLGSRIGYFLYFSWIAFICGCSFCIFSADFMLVMRSGSSARLMMTVRMMIDHAPVVGHVIVRPLQPQEQRPGDEAEEAEVDHVAQIGAVHLARRGVGVHRLENLERLGTDEQPLAGDAAGVADGRAQHVVRGRPCSDQASSGSFGTVMESCRVTIAAVSGLSGRKMAAKILVLRTSPVEGPAQGVAAADLLGCQTLDLAIGHVLDLRDGVYEAQSSDRRMPAATVGNACTGLPFCVTESRRDDVGVAEGESLVDGDAAVGVFEGQLAGSGEVAGRAGDVQRRVDLVPQLLVVGVEAEGQSELGTCRY